MTFHESKNLPAETEETKEIVTDSTPDRTSSLLPAVPLLTDAELRQIEKRKEAQWKRENRPVLSEEEVERIGFIPESNQPEPSPFEHPPDGVLPEEESASSDKPLTTSSETIQIDTCEKSQPKTRQRRSARVAALR